MSLVTRKLIYWESENDAETLDIRGVCLMVPQERTELVRREYGLIVWPWVAGGG